MPSPLAKFSPIAQWVECLAVNQEVVGSRPARGAKFILLAQRKESAGVRSQRLQVRLLCEIPGIISSIGRAPVCRTGGSQIETGMVRQLCWPLAQR
jgi:hypothetical protein